MEKVKIGIIGLGFMGTTHFDIYRANDKAEVVAIADSNAAKQQGDISSVVANIGGGTNDTVDLSGVSVYADGLDLINDPAVELVDICVPLHLHKQFALAALKAGKHVLCEKPLARNSDDAAEIVAAAKASDKFFSVGMCVRYWPEYRYVYEQYKAGKYGKMRNAFFKRFSPTVSGNGWQDWFSDEERSGGALLEMHLHDTDQILYFFGRPKSVNTTGCKGFRSKESWDHVFSSYEFEDGSMVVSEGGWTAAKGTPFEMSFQLICDNATVIFNHAGLNVYYEDGTTETPDLSAYKQPTGWHEELNYFVESIAYGKQPDKYISLDELVDGICIVEAERKSVESKKSVKIEYKQEA
jgi:predicted dehydrogenase